MRLTLTLAALAATIAAAPASAQAVTDSDSAFARGVVLGSHQLVKAADLDFGIVAANPTTPGTVAIAASATGGHTVTGGVTALPSTFQAAKFDGAAAPLETVALTLTPPPGGIIQDGAGNNINVALALDSAGTPRTADNAGGFTVYVGGTFNIAAAQPAGVYSAQFQLTAEYQ
ncbi:MAG: DUF4402 domain-containing protein [Sphingomicrobium sp.]